jgi:hypothetical protein
MATVPYSLKDAILSDLFSGVSYKYLFDTDGIGDIMSCYYPHYKFDIKCLQLLDGYLLLYRISQTDNASYAGTKANYNACFTLGS